MAFVVFPQETNVFAENARCRNNKKEGAAEPYVRQSPPLATK
jgi:hypothetical protein